MGSIASYRTEIVIDRPIDEVFTYLSDLRNEMEWNPGARRIEKLTGGPVGIGTRFAAEWRNAPRTEVLVTDHRPPTRWRTASRSWGMDVVFTGTLTADAARTRYVASLDISANGFARVLLPFAVSAMKRQDRAHMRRIADVLGRSSSPREPAPSPEDVR